MITIKRKYTTTNKKILKILNTYWYYLNSINFIIDNQNNLYFCIGNNYNTLYYNYKIHNIELLAILKDYNYFGFDICTINYLEKENKINENLKVIDLTKLNYLENQKDYDFIKKEIGLNFK